MLVSLGSFYAPPAFASRNSLALASVKPKSGFATKREAVAATNELQESVSRGNYVRPSKRSVGEY